MFEKEAKRKIFNLLFLISYFLLFFTGSVCRAFEQLDKTKYITVDQIQPGMEAYCLTCYKGTEIEKFSLEVLDVVRDFEPGKDAILVKGTDERFIHTGPVGGCSGSPVYIDGRLAGALAFAWIYSKDPLYGVTPIEEMLQVGKGDYTEQTTQQMGFAFDYSAPIDFTEIDRQIKNVSLTGKKNYLSGATTLPCPLITSGLPSGVCEQLNAEVEPFGLMAVAGIGAGADTSGAEDVQLTPGASLTIPLVTGDITMTIIGTVTEVIDDKVYGFGHGFLGYGLTDLPMATGKVHTVVSSVVRSFKLASALETTGALRVDESAAVIGQLGAEARMIPLTIEVDRYNDAEKRLYNCHLVDNRMFTPIMLRAVVTGAALMLGDLPPDHTIKYKVAINIEDAEPITFENVSTSMDIRELVAESLSSVALIMNNPYKKVAVKSIDFDIHILPKNVVSHIWSVDLSDSKIKAGQKVDVSVIVESVLAGKKKYQYSLKIPNDLKPGKYELIISGGYGYLEFLRKAAQYKFVYHSLPTLIESLNNLLHIRRDKLYCILVLPRGGVAVAKARLPDLPPTKALVLADATRTLKPRPYLHWHEKSFQTDTIIVGKQTMHITVEK
ncbi:MAG: SpoIVB peptidase S55 domain-containing protein [Planctomycetota bacterium]|jgi:hypothetical protein